MNEQTTDRCPHCQRKPAPDPDEMWQGILQQIIHDAWNLTMFATIVLSSVVVLTGEFKPGWMIYYGSFMLGAVGLDALYIVHHLIRYGFPFRHIGGTGPLG